MGNKLNQAHKYKTKINIKEQEQRQKDLMQTIKFYDNNKIFNLMVI